MIPKATLFISSPGDVNEERVISARVIQRLSEEFKHRVLLDPIFWEHEPMLMTDGFQTQIMPPSQTEIFIGILWARMGTRLPANITREDGSRYQSGTEYEFEDAWRGYEKNGNPNILVYRKTAKPLFNPDAPDFEDKVQQKKTLDLFCKRWFQDDEGSFVAAFNPFADLAEFEERLEIHLRKLLNRLYPPNAADQEQRMVTWQQGSPFRGLSVFDAEHAPVFFGRTRAISEIIATLRKASQDGHAFTMVLGTSGAGKSSLVRAGVLPLLIQPGVIEGVGAWKHCIFRPSDGGHELLEKFAKGLLSADGLNPEDEYDSDELTLLLKQVGNAPKDYIGRTQNIPYASLCKDLQGFINQRLNRAAHQMGLQDGQMNLALVIDQWEELYTLEYISPKLRHLFINIIAALARLDNVWLISTCRSDFYHRCTEHPALVALMKEHGQYLLTAPSVSEITQMIRSPAQAAGLSYGQDKDSKRKLDDVLLDTMVQHPNNLALLQFTLDALYQRRDDQQELSYQVYQEMGGIEGALAQRAEDIYRQLSFAAQAAFAPLMRTLITIEVSDDTPIAGRRMLLGTDKVSTALQEILDAYINARLVVTDIEPDGTAVARLAHDALIHHWSRLKNWIEEERHLLRVRVRTKEAARHWVDEGRPNELLLHEGHTLSQAEELLHQWQDSIESFVKNYIEKSLAHVNQQQEQDKLQQQQRLKSSRRLNSILAGLSIIATLGASYGLYARYQANQAADSAKTAKIKAENALSLAERNSQSAYRQAKRANKIAKLASEERNKALRSQTLYLSALAKHEIHEGDAVTGALLALGGLPRAEDKSTRPYMPQAEAQLQIALQQQHEYKVLSEHQADVLQVVFSPDGKQIATISADHHARIWDSHTGQLLQTLQGHEAAVWSIQFNPAGDQLLTASLDKSVIVWQVGDGKKRLVFKGHHAGLNSAHYSPDGQQIISADMDGHLYFWDADSGESLHSAHAHHDRITSLSFSPDGEHMLTTSRDRTASLWSLSTMQRLFELEGHQRDVNAADFSSNGDHIVTASDDKTARIWSRTSGASLLELKGHIREIQKVRFSPDGRYVVTASKDHRLGVWDVHTGERRFWLRRHQHGITDIEFHPQNPDQLLSASRDGSMILWSLNTGDMLVRFAGHQDRLNAVSFSPDGLRIASASSDKTARLWRIEPLTQIATLAFDSAPQDIQLHPDGNNIWAAVGAQLQQWQIDVKGLSQIVQQDNQSAILHTRHRPDGKQVLCASADTLKLWDIEAKQWHLLAEQQRTDFMGFSSDSRYIFSANAEKSYLWSHNQRLISQLPSQTSALVDFSFSHDNQYLATAYANGKLALWRLPDGALLKQWQADEQAVRGIYFHPENRQLLSLGHSQGARLWHIPAAELNVRYDASAQTQFQQAQFSPDGHLLALSDNEGDILLWDTHTGMEKARLRGHKSAVSLLRFGHSNQRLISVAHDGVQLWDLSAYIAIMRLEQSLAAPEKTQISANMQRLLAFKDANTVQLWQLFPETQTVVKHAEQVLPRQLSDAQRRSFFLE